MLRNASDNNYFPIVSTQLSSIELLNTSIYLEIEKMIFLNYCFLKVFWSELRRNPQKVCAPNLLRSVVTTNESKSHF